jgi:hypothetical protein
MDLLPLGRVEHDSAEDPPVTGRTVRQPHMLCLEVCLSRTTDECLVLWQILTEIMENYHRKRSMRHVA